MMILKSDSKVLSQLFFVVFGVFSSILGWTYMHCDLNNPENVYMIKSIRFLFERRLKNEKIISKTLQTAV